MTKKEFDVNKTFNYNIGKKRRFIIFISSLALLTISFILYYIFILKNSNNGLMNFINSIISHVTVNIGARTLIGIFYSTLFGGLFFFPVPIELVFLNFLRAGHFPGLVILLFLAGLVVSFSIDYFIGSRFSEISRKLIGAKKFYKIKGKINKYGGWGVFLFNATPLPSQVLSVILGVFRYNKTRFYLLFLLGQSVKFIALVLGYIYIL